MKVEKLAATLHDKMEYLIHLRNLKQALNYELASKKVYKVIKFNQNAWLKQYIDINTYLTKNAKNDFENFFFELMSNAVFGKTMEKMRKHRAIKLVTTERRKIHLVSEPDYHNTKFLTNDQIMKEFVGLRAKTYSYLKCNNDKDKKAKGKKKCVIKRKF